MIDDFKGKKVFDLFCGTGTITQVLARHASEVIGVEIVEEAVEAAREAAALNGLENCRNWQDLHRSKTVRENTRVRQQSADVVERD